MNNDNQKPKRVLTHHLEYDPKTDRWACKCDYMLGRDGHERLYAPCPLFAAKPEPE
jgi:hypothetical protein